MGANPAARPGRGIAWTAQPGEVTERLKVQHWKCCVRLVRTGGSNPPLSASPPTCRLIPGMWGKVAPPMTLSSTASGPAGLLVIDKPLGRTSFAMVALVRGKLRAGGAPRRVKVGHGGTLDPLATGVLIVLVGRATRLCEQVMAGAKRYVCEIDLARQSASHDLETEPTEVALDAGPTAEQVQRACEQWTGRVMQTPPAFSAMKVGGRRAYELARAGQQPAMPPREVLIQRIGVLEYEFPRLRLEVECGKGVYIRSLARDLGLAIGGGGLLTMLRRTAVGPYDESMAIAPERLPESLVQDDLVLPAEFA